MEQEKNKTIPSKMDRTRGCEKDFHSQASGAHRKGLDGACNHQSLSREPRGFYLMFDARPPGTHRNQHFSKSPPGKFENMNLLQPQNITLDPHSSRNNLCGNLNTAMNKNSQEDSYITR